MNDRNDHTEPKRLLESIDTPEALRAALVAIAPRDPSEEVLARLRAKLPAQPTAARIGHGTAFTLTTHGMLLMLLMGAALGLREDGRQPPGPASTSSNPSAPLLGLSAVGLPPANQAPPRARVATSTPDALQPADWAVAMNAREAGLAAGRPSLPSPRPHVRVPASTSGSTASSAREAARPERSQRAAARRPPDVSAVPHATPSVQIDSVATTEPAGTETAVRDGEPSATAVRAARVVGTATQPAPDTPSAVAAASTAPVVEDPQDEAGLLYRAKRLAAREPAAALALLAVHARHFADGALAQERDVLTIRLLRRLGRRVLADWLAAEFRARYPHSVYLPSTEP